VPRLRSLLDDRPGKHGVTMTAELSDLYPTRADGVRSILRACAQALPGPPRILDVRGGFLSVDEALDRPLEVAAANWVGTARLVARARRDALLIDVGSTTTDIVPIRAGEPRPAGRTDTERLLSGELVYSGVLRTPPSSLTDVVPLHGMWCRVSQSTSRSWATSTGFSARSRSGITRSPPRTGAGEAGTKPWPAWPASSAPISRRSGPPPWRRSPSSWKNARSSK